MILGELIGLIVLPIMWTLFVIGILGLRQELKKGCDRPKIGFIYTMCFSVGCVMGIALLVWFIDYTGIGNEICSFVNNLWNLEL